MPKIREAMEHRYEMYKHQMDEPDQMEADLSTLLICPPVDQLLGHAEKDSNELERVYQSDGARLKGTLLRSESDWLDSCFLQIPYQYFPRSKQGEAEGSSLLIMTTWLDFDRQIR